MAESANAVLRSLEREILWEAPDEFRVRAIAGAISLDFTPASLPPNGTVEIHIQYIGADVEITVPDDVDILFEATPILDSVEQKLLTGGRAPNPPSDNGGDLGGSCDAAQYPQPEGGIYPSPRCRDRVARRGRRATLPD